MSFASESSWKKHLFLLHRIKRPQPWDYCDDIRRERKQTVQQEANEVTELGSFLIKTIHINNRCIISIHDINDSYIFLSKTEIG